MMQRLLCAIAFLLACPIAFAECPKAVEELLFPPNNLRTRNTTMTFTWSPVEAMGYELVLIRNDAPVKVTEICSGGPHPNCKVTLKPGRYEWYVRAYNEGCKQGTESKQHFSLHIEGCTEVPTPLAPLSGAGDVPVTGTTLKWSGSAEAYDLVLEKGTQCTTTTPTKRVTGTELATGPLEGDTTYAWQVRESNESCQERKFSDCTTFTTCNPPGQFDLQTPVVDGTHVNLSWTPAQRAREYVVYTTSLGATTSYKTTSPSICLRLWNSPSSDFDWKVEAISGSCKTTGRSDGQNGRFKTRNCIPPTLIAPPTSVPTMEAFRPITFEWKAPQYPRTCEVKDGSFYLVLFKKIKGNVASFPSMCNDRLNPESTSCSATFPPGEYIAYVDIHELTEANNIEVRCTSVGRNFTVK